jgi:hypothetical protein
MGAVPICEPWHQASHSATAPSHPSTFTASIDASLPPLLLLLLPRVDWAGLGYGRLSSWTTIHPNHADD